jgi:hypothetical protein
MGARRLFALWALLGAAVVRGDDDDGDDDVELPTLYDTLKADVKFDAFLELANDVPSVRKLLKNEDSGYFTVFTPTANAFQKSKVKYDEFDDDELEEL